ncbi:MAG: hypothetical protein AMJ60_04330 [Desulfobacterales bacterium SG8_35]|nr:MAG: hypothetical protein AMJ60_04330 [Desulfobacterales bacterium SG8_35]
MMFPCAKDGKQNMQRLFTIATLVTFLGLSLALISCKVKQQEFASPADAVQALVTALKTNNDKELLSVLGPEANELIYSGDDVADLAKRQKFLEFYEEQNHIAPDGDRFVLVIGKNDWPFPIPLVKKADRWVFDSVSGKEEILDRRIGRNELNTIQVILAIVDAQREYAMKDRDGDSLLEYAQKFRSEPGKKNGLYWQTLEGEDSSPLGELVANARAEGYTSEGGQNNPEPYQGYYYRILTAQGQNAAGGSYDYVVDGKMIGGFAIVAYPAEYDNSGVMTFIVNHDGVVYQKDLGENTGELAKTMKLYDPDETWMPVQ